MDTRYGADLQKFILDNYQVRAVIKFDTQAFQDALVGSSVIILSREKNEENRNQHVAKFLRVKEAIDVNEIVSIVEDELDSEQMIRTKNYRLVTRVQKDLYEEEKWNVYLSAPPIYFEALAADNIVAVEDVAEVSRGITSGANKFFYARSEEFDQLGLSEYTTNLLKATGQIEKIRFDETNAKEWAVLDLHDLVTEALDETAGTLSAEPAERVKQWLTSHGHEELLEYIEWGEMQRYQDRSSFSGKEVWFDLGEVPVPSILNTRFTWREHRMVWNEANAIADQQFYMIMPESDVDALLLCGILNSRFVWLANELLGRRAGGEGMTRLQKTIYETERLPIPDPRKLSHEERNRIIEAFSDLMDKEDEIEGEDPRQKEHERDVLDRAVLSTVGMEDRLDELKQAVADIVATREKGAGTETRVLVNRVEDREVIDLAGVSEAHESATLGDYQ